MARFRLQLEKYFSGAGEYWVNVYHVEATDLAAAAALGASIRDAERPLYTSGITITKAHVDDGIAHTDVFQNVVYNMNGSRTGTTTANFPLWVTARVDFNVVGGGRPSRKFLRGVLLEADADFMTVGTAMQTLLATYANAIVAIGAVVDPQGQLFSSGAPFAAPAMRQLRRGSKKRVTL